MQRTSMHNHFSSMSQTKDFFPVGSGKSRIKFSASQPLMLNNPEFISLYDKAKPFAMSYVINTTLDKDQRILQCSQVTYVAGSF